MQDVSWRHLWPRFCSAKAAPRGKLPQFASSVSGCGERAGMLSRLNSTMPAKALDRSRTARSDVGQHTRDTPKSSAMVLTVPPCVLHRTLDVNNRCIATL